MSRLVGSARASRFAVLAFAIYIALAFAVVTSKEDIKNDDSRNEQRYDNKYGDKDKTWWGYTTREPAGLYTFLLACIGTIQAGLFFRQLQLMNRNLLDTRAMVIASNSQASLARDSLIASNRAWLTLGEPSISGMEIDRDEIRVSFRVSMTNVGRSPALSVYVVPSLTLYFINQKVFLFDQIKQMVFDAKLANHTGQFIIYPSQTAPAKDVDSVYVARCSRDWMAQHGPVPNVVPNATLILIVIYRLVEDPTRWRHVVVPYQVGRRDAAPIDIDTIGEVPIQDIGIGRIVAVEGFEID